MSLGVGKFPKNSTNNRKALSSPKFISSLSFMVLNTDTIGTRDMIGVCLFFKQILSHFWGQKIEISFLGKFF
jgi:hypothetical protein